MELYVPVGHGWWDDATWRFGEVFGDDRLAQQYLVIHDGVYEERDGYYATYDREFPEREIKCVTPEQFHALGKWRFVMPSVQENQHGYHRLAQRCGATSLYQVGNRGQRIDWSLEPLVLCSAEQRLDGRGVRYHQEFDKDGMFAYRPPEPGAETSAASFVNCFTLMPSQWATFKAVEAEMPDWRWGVYGEQGRDGKLCPTSLVRDAMAQYGWAWHDKPQGDGFGHVIHYWAAVGRPLIGHAAHYAGLYAGPLWEDGITAVTLDGRTHGDVAALLRAYASDPGRHAQMCLRIRDRLEELVDYDREEVAIRALLGL